MNFDPSVLASLLPVFQKYFMDPTFLMTLIVVSSILASLRGLMSWRTTGIILLLGAAYSQLAQVFGPYAAATTIASSVVSFVMGKLWAEFKRSFLGEE